MLVMLAVTVSGKPNTYLVETADESAEVLSRRKELTTSGRSAPGEDAEHEHEHDQRIPEHSNRSDCYTGVIWYQQPGLRHPPRPLLLPGLHRVHLRSDQPHALPRRCGDENFVYHVHDAVISTHVFLCH